MEGDPSLARSFLEQAYALIPQLDVERETALEEGATLGDDCLEGRIIAMLLQLPEEGE